MQANPSTWIKSSSQILSKKISNGSSVTIKSRNYSFKYTCMAETVLIGIMENNNLQLKIEGPTHQFNISESNLHNLNSHNNVNKASILKHLP